MTQKNRTRAPKETHPSPDGVIERTNSEELWDVVIGILTRSLVKKEKGKQRVRSAPMPFNAAAPESAATQSSQGTTEPVGEKQPTQANVGAAAQQPLPPAPAVGNPPPRKGCIPPVVIFGLIAALITAGVIWALWTGKIPLPSGSATATQPTNETGSKSQPLPTDGDMTGSASFVVGKSIIITSEAGVQFTLTATSTGFKAEESNGTTTTADFDTELLVAGQSVGKAVRDGDASRLIFSPNLGRFYVVQSPDSGYVTYRWRFNMDVVFTLFVIQNGDSVLFNYSDNKGHEQKNIQPTDPNDNHIRFGAEAGWVLTIVDPGKHGLGLQFPKAQSAYSPDGLPTATPAP